jgi:membrane protein implicated in regulation of membrane protease activity
MSWWLWVLVGIALLVVEVSTPGGLFALFFGAGALVVALLAWMGVGETLQWLAFAVLSLAGMAALRGPLLRRLAQAGPAGPPTAELVGEQATLLDDLPAGGQGRAELRGTSWTVRAASGIPMKKGQRCVVERVDGLTLWVRAE